MRTPLRVLIVEDDEDDALLIVNRLNHGGYAVEYQRVETVEQMNKAFASQKWDLVIGDYVMPQFSAEEALSLAKGYMPDIPFIAVSGKVGEEVAVRLIRAGAYDFLHKDNLESLPLVVHQALEQPKLRESPRVLRSEPVRVLIVDDSEDDALLLIHELKRAGYSLIFQRVDTPESMAAALKECPWDVIISDYMMPRFGGPAALQTLKDSRLDLPFILVSGKIGEKPAVEIMKVGAHDFIPKDNLRRLAVSIEREMNNARFRAAKILAEEELKRMNEELECRVLERTAELAVSNELLGKAAREWQMTFDALNDMVWILDAGFKILRSNKSADLFVGKKAEDITGRHCWELVHGTQRPIEGCPVLKVRKTLRRESMNLTLGDRSYEVIADPILSESGKLEGIVHILSDITDRKRAELELLASEQKYRDLFEESITPIYNVNIDGTLLVVNPAFEKLFGYAKGELVGANIIVIYVDPDDRPRFQREIEIKGFVSDYPIKFKKKDGAELDCLLTAGIRHSADGTVSGYRGIVRDVTVQKTLERQLSHAQKMEAVGTLAGGIAHDFNNLLTVTLGYSEVLLQEKEENNPDYPDLLKIREASLRGADLVQRLFAFSRKAETKFRPVNLNHVLREAVKLLSRTIPKMVAIELKPADRLKTIDGDPGQIDQVLINLALNARAAMPEGGKLVFKTENVTLDDDFVNISLDSAPGDYVLLTVSDTGHGMDQATLERIFEPFFTTKAPGQGTGLGLAMVYGIVKHHRGFLTCESEPGVGTTFRVYFPAVETENDLALKAMTSLPSGGTETVLVVDDEKPVRDIVAKTLVRFGYTVLVANDGEQALEEYGRNRDQVALVILDVIMPRMGGKQCLRELNRMNPDIKVLMASGQSARSDQEELLELGAKGFIAKPCEMIQLLNSIREVLDSQ